MEKHSMRHLLWAALFLLYCSCGCLAAVVQHLPQKGESGLQAYTVATPTTTTTDDDKTGPDWKPIRIGVYTKFVEDILKECKEQRPESNSNPTVEFCGGDNQMTTEKMNTLFKDILPKAIKLHTDRLKVKQVGKSENIISEELNPLPEKCGPFKDPLGKAQKIPDVDFMIYVGLSAKREKVEICTQDNEKRPTSAVIKFIPKEINAAWQYIRVTAHEIAHGLGFQYELMEKLGMIELNNSDLQSSQGSSSVKTSRMVKFEKSVDKLKSHYKCKEDDQVKGLFLENEGEDQEKPSHWERLIAKDELMSTYIGEASGMYYSALTLAAFHSMGFYKAVFEKAEPMGWGKVSMCKLLKAEKNLTVFARSDLFCKEEDKVLLQCTSDRFALGICSNETGINDSSEGYKYIKDGTHIAKDLMNGVPFIRSLKGTACEGGEESLMPGSILSNMSRCLNVEKPVNFSEGDQKNGVKVYGICAKVKCEKETKKVSVLLKGENEKESWHDCSDGKKTFDVVAGSVFSGGKIECPKFEEVCTGLLEAETPTNIKFYDGTEVTNGYKGDVIPVKEEEDEGNDQNSSSASPSSVSSSGSHDTAAAAAATSQSSSNPNGTNLTEGQMKEKPNHTNDARRPDSSIMVISYMVPLALLMCVVGFVMVP
ncbi:surface protease GP63 [Trypanosoma theileri]|uniref:Leishmanolysin-like peptidase n=1 Tax=Trypanosoma theileri TaxID=67003 RepID=A0A1X0NZN6_9TRYP|nr:surface protease GP63 [Trypanosoma theileri]ORC90018.1 surface protease GP63 [Trypanosoma theileri]